MFVRICALFVAMAIVSETVDPRILRRSSDTDNLSEPSSVPAALPPNDDPITHHEHLNRRLVTLERRLNESDAQIVQLQNTTSHAESKISELEAALSERCTCSNPGDGETGPDTDMDDWVDNMDMESINNMREEMTRDMAEQNRNSSSDDSEMMELDDKTIEEYSMALAKIVTMVVENGGMGRMIGDPPAENITRYRREMADTEEEEMMVLKEVMTDVIRSANKKVAFSSIRTDPLFGITNVTQAIKFQKNLANKGKAFHQETGMFVCKIPGIYYFSFTMRSYDGKHIGVVLMKNSEKMVSMTTDASLRKVMQTQSIILSLVKGDQVWLVLGGSELFGIFGRNHYHYNTFSGHILYPNYISSKVTN